MVFSTVAFDHSCYADSGILTVTEDKFRNTGEVHGDAAEEVVITAQTD